MKHRSIFVHSPPVKIMAHVLSIQQDVSVHAYVHRHLLEVYVKHPLHQSIEHFLDKLLFLLIDLVVHPGKLLLNVLIKFGTV